MRTTGNNFNLLRLAFALMVVAYHLVFLSRVPAWSGAVPLLSSLAEIGVQGFFVLSGYLVYASLERSSSLGLYAEKRIRRLYPAYATVILVCAAGGLMFSPEARADLVAVARYVGANLVFANFLEPNLPGVFQGAANAVPEINGALWTLKIEVLFYLVLPILGWIIGKAGHARWLVIGAIYVGAEVWRIGLESAGQGELSRQLPGQLSYFVTGMALYRLQLRGSLLHIAGLTGLAVLVFSHVIMKIEAVEALALGAAAVWIATGWRRLPDAATFGDLSYGAYITHFPIIQTVAALGLFASSPWMGLGAAITVSLLAALLLWHLVEKPSLRSDSAYRAPAG